MREPMCDHEWVFSDADRICVLCQRKEERVWLPAKHVLPRGASITRKGDTGSWELSIQGVRFPWPITRDPVQLTDITGPPDNVYVLNIGLLIEGPITGAAEFNEFLDEEADARRVRSADHRELLHEQLTGKIA